MTISTLGFFILSQACSELDPELGNDLIDSTIEVGHITLPIKAQTVLEDSLPSSGASLFLLGAINDSIFGKTTASIYTELLPPMLPYRFGNSNEIETIDSVVLSFSYSGFWGDSLSSLTVNVYELSEEIPRGINYSNSNLSHLEEPLSTFTFSPAPNDSVPVGQDTLPPHLRIPIPISFGERFKDAKDELEEMSSNDEFRDFFKGFYIEATATDENGIILQLDHQSSLSRLVFHYTTSDGDEGMNTLRMNEAVNRKFIAFNHFDHQFAADIIKDQIFGAPQEDEPEILFVQGMGNYKTKITITGLSSIKNEEDQVVAINSAKLIVPIEQSFSGPDDKLTPNLLLSRRNASDTLVFVEDYNIDRARNQNFAYFGGRLSSDKDTYTINITQHVQLLIDEHSDYPNSEMYLIVASPVVNAGLAAIKGTNQEDGLRLEVIYTKPKQTE